MDGYFSMEERDPSNIPDLHPELCQFTTTIYDGNHLPTDGSGHSLNDSGPPTPIYDRKMDQGTECTSPLILQPYEIEEPDEPRPVNRRPGLPRLPDYFEKWQRELKDSVNQLENEPNKAACGSRIFSSPRRGQKRKVAQPETIPRPPMSSTQSQNKHRLNEHPILVPRLSPKRRRRQNKLARAAEQAHPTSLDGYRETQANDSSSSDQPPTDATSNGTTDEVALADEMDID